MKSPIFHLFLLHVSEKTLSILSTVLLLNCTNLAPLHWVPCLSRIMAANYWASTQRRYWQFSKDALAEIRQKLENEDASLVHQYPLPDRRLLSIFFNQRKLSSKPKLAKL